MSAKAKLLLNNFQIQIYSFLNWLQAPQTQTLHMNTKSKNGNSSSSSTSLETLVDYSKNFKKSKKSPNYDIPLKNSKKEKNVSPRNLPSSSSNKLKTLSDTNRNVLKNAQSFLTNQNFSESSFSNSRSLRLVSDNQESLKNLKVNKRASKNSNLGGYGDDDEFYKKLILDRAERALRKAEEIQRKSSLVQNRRIPNCDTDVLKKKSNYILKENRKILRETSSSLSEESLKIKRRKKRKVKRAERAQSNLTNEKNAKEKVTEGKKSNLNLANDENTNNNGKSRGDFFKDKDEKKAKENKEASTGEIEEVVKQDNEKIEEKSEEQKEKPSFMPKGQLPKNYPQNLQTSRAELKDTPTFKSMISNFMLNRTFKSTHPKKQPHLGVSFMFREGKIKRTKNLLKTEKKANQARENENFNVQNNESLEALDSMDRGLKINENEDFTISSNTFYRPKTPFTEQFHHLLPNASFY